MDEAGDVTEPRGPLDEGVHRLSRRHVDRRGAHIEPCVAHHVGSGVGVLFMEVCEHDLLAGADPPGDGLTDRSDSDDDDDFTHGELLQAGLLRKRSTRTAQMFFDQGTTIGHDKGVPPEGGTARGSFDWIAVPKVEAWTQEATSESS